MASQEKNVETASSEASALQEYETYDGYTNQVHEQIRHLARTASHQSAGGDELSLVRTLSHMSLVPGTAPVGYDDVDPRLDPNSDQFNSRFWIKNYRKLLYENSDYYKPSSLGFVYKDLRAYGQLSDSDFQTNFGNVVIKRAVELVHSFQKADASTQFDILKPMDGVIPTGEVTVVLGRPGAGCSTFLKTVALQTYGFHVDKESILSYDGLTPEHITNHFRGEVVYCAETERHFPHLSVGDTLKFAALMRTPKNRFEGVTRDAYATHMAQVAMATFGLSHTANTKVGNDYIRGVSGGERKRVSIAEVYLSQASLQCWDNSTRGLDSATALEFIRALKTQATVINATPLVAIYQCSQDAYDLFDNVVLLYEGYQIYCGSAKTAKDYFLKMGYYCPDRQTTADFLTSLTNPSEREAAKGFEDKVPKTPKEFSDYWRASPERQLMLKKIERKMSKQAGDDKLAEFHEHHRARQTSKSRPQSSCMVSFGMQVKYIMGRNILRTKGDPSVTLFTIFGNTIMALITASLFYNMSKTTADFYLRSAVLFFATLFNSFSSLLEIFSLYESRPIVEKHKTFALYHPAADAVASIITELPSKVTVALSFNLVLYFMTNLNRSAGPFFFYMLVNFTSTLSMSHLFRAIGAATNSLSEAMTPASILLLALSMFTGFVIPTPNMLGWCRWLNYLDPIAYGFEALMANEFHGRTFDCSVFVPSGLGYNDVTGDHRICSVVGSAAGATVVNGDSYIETAFSYYNSHKWRNWGILVGFAIAGFVVYIFLVEQNKGAMQKGEILVYQRSALKARKKQVKADAESGVLEKIRPEDHDSDATEAQADSKLPKSNSIFHWRNLRYQVQIKSETRVILDGVDGWVKPGQVTALMGASGAGKTTLLNALSERLTSGTITDGTRMVNGKHLDSSFQRSIGYVQQQDLHLQTSTVREALNFSAYLRQPACVSREEKHEYVEYIIDLLEMRPYADAVVGVAGEGLNVEQRKRLTIGVELVAKPSLLVFLDEPTSGLDSQTAWSICKLIRKLADHGQAILCTIHQPSAMLMKEFDRLLFLQRGGKTVYFGDLGENSQTLIDYFESYGAPKCPPDANPAEWMLEVIGAAPGSTANQDYYQVWLNSKEYQQVHAELDKMELELAKIPEPEDPERFKLYATGFLHQYSLVLKRVLEQNWRTPSYTYSKLLLVVTASLFNGFVFFKAHKTQQGLQNQMFSVFMFLVVFNTLVQQYLPNFIHQRDLYEVRERPSKTFSWVAFITAQITSEVPWNILCGTISFFCWYYPVGLYNNATATDTVHARGASMWFAIVLFYIYTSTMGQMAISFIELADNAANLASLLFTVCLNFCGVLVTKEKLPGFWIFMYRCNPFTYLVSAMLSIGLANSDVQCSEQEFRLFAPPAGENCGQYLKTYIDSVGGYVLDGNSTTQCQYCAMSDTNVFLKSIGSLYSERWRNIGIFIAFIGVNVIATISFYYLARVPKGRKQK